MVDQFMSTINRRYCAHSLSLRTYFNCYSNKNYLPVEFHKSNSYSVFLHFVCSEKTNFALSLFIFPHIQDLLNGQNI